VDLGDPGKYADVLAVGSKGFVVGFSYRSQFVDGY